MTHFVVDDRLLEHPKFIDLTPDAIVMWVGGMGYCSRNTTDGTIPKGMTPRLFNFQRPTDQIAAELVERGLWIDQGDTWGVHDYLDHQRSSEEIERIREQNRNRKRKQRTSNADVTRESRVTHGGVTTPSTSTTTDISPLVSGNTQQGLSTGRDDDERTKPASQIIAERRAALRPDLTNPAGWRRKVAHSLTDPATDDGRELAKLAVQHPEWTAEQLADGIQPPAGQTRRKPERVDCDRCHGSGWLPETDPAQRCDHGAAA